MNPPHINITPLIDVLLVLLVIFMVVAPMKPDSFKAKIPRGWKIDAPAPPDTLVVIVGTDLSLALNTEPDLGTPSNTRPLIERLKKVFEERTVNGAVPQATAGDAERPYTDAIERTVFIKARNGSITATSRELSMP